MTELEVLKNVVQRLEGAAIDYLVLSKLAWAKPTMSELQLRDVRALLATGADVEYLRRWAPELSVSGLLEEQLSERHQP